MGNQKEFEQKSRKSHRKTFSKHCVKIVQIWSYFWSVFSCIRIEYEPEITPYLDTFHAVEIYGNPDLLVQSQ